MYNIARTGAAGLHRGPAAPMEIGVIGIKLVAVQAIVRASNAGTEAGVWIRRRFPENVWIIFRMPAAGLRLERQNV